MQSHDGRWASDQHDIHVVSCGCHSTSTLVNEKTKTALIKWLQVLLNNTAGWTTSKSPPGIHFHIQQVNPEVAWRKRDKNTFFARSPFITFWPLSMSVLNGPINSFKKQLIVVRNKHMYPQYRVIERLLFILWLVQGVESVQYKRFGLFWWMMCQTDFVLLAHFGQWMQHIVASTVANIILHACSALARKEKWFIAPSKAPETHSSKHAQI